MKGVLDQVHAALGRLLPDGVAGAVSDPTGDYGRSETPELASVVDATAKRRREFAAGRYAARAAMAGLGYPPYAIPGGADRAPVWPGGLVGSISHCASACVAVSAPEGAMLAIGIDIEPAEPLPSDLIDTICTPGERAWLATHLPGERGILARMIFSAKEAAYKCQYPLSSTVLDFDALTIRPDDSGPGFRAVFRQPVAPFQTGSALPGRSVTAAGYILTCVYLPPAGIGAPMPFAPRLAEPRPEAMALPV
ncbi:MAG: 4'-phosphopantetheinyl transferase superfamily protein [Rhodobacteraceae bacterium]|nr:4'-phosphopantetheinyl transferase superfamily protein [Paracoccaceae bacterium]